LAIFDQDYSTLISSGSDAYNALFPRVCEANWRYRVTAGVVGRNLYSFLSSHPEVRKGDTVAKAFAFSEFGRSVYLANLLERAATVGVQVGLLGEQEKKEWDAEVKRVQDEGHWFAALTYIGVWTKKRGSGRETGRL